MADVGTQVNITELRDILPVGTVVKDIDGVEYTRVDAGRYGWLREGSADPWCPWVPLVIVSRPN